MTQNQTAESIPELAKEILANPTSRSFCQRERVAYSEKMWTPVEVVGEQLKAHFELTEVPHWLKVAPFMQ